LTTCKKSSLPNFNKSGVLFYGQKADFSAEFYLFGTMHVNSDAAYKYYDLATSCIDKSSIYAGEIDLAINASEDLQTFIELEDTDLNELLGNKKYKKLEFHLKKYFGLELSNFNKLVPFFLLNVINELSLNDQSNRKALDIALFEYAVERGVQTTGLEDLFEHYNVLQRIPYEIQAVQLKQVILNVSRFRTNLKKVSCWYQDADIRMLYQMTKKSLGKMKGIMLYDRNKIMAEKIDKLANDERVFSACGVSHLWGKYGLLRLLKQRGYKFKVIN